MRDYYKQIYIHKFNNLKKINRPFLQNLQTTKNKDEINNWNNPIAINRTEFVTQKLPKKKSPHSHDFTEETNQTYKEELTIENEEGTLPHSYFEAINTFI